MKYLVDWLFILSFVPLIWKMKIIRPFKALNKDYLSVDNCNAMRGVFALTPLVVHIGNCISYSKPLNWWSINGNMVVEAFFFLSGFGLMKQYMLRDDYAKGFLVKRMPKILIPYIATILLYWAGTFVFYGFLYSPFGVLNTILCGVPIVTFSWFMVHLILFYLFFWLMMLVCKKHYNLMIAGGILYFALTSWLFYSRGFGMHWYETSLGLTLGIFWAVYEKQIFSIMEKWYWPVFIFVLVLTAVVYKIDIPWLYGLFPSDFAFRNVLVFLLMCLCIVLGMMKCAVGNRVSHFLGYISLEIYLLHGFAIMMLKNTKYDMSNEALFTILVPIITIVMAYVMKKCMEFVFDIIYGKRKLFVKK